MPYVFLLIGLALVISAIEGTYNQLGSQLKADFTGKTGFQYWALAICMVGAIGYIDQLRPVTNKMLWLVLIVLFLANGGAWSNLVNAFQQGAISPKKQPAATGAGSGSGSSSGGWQTSVQSSPSSGSGISAIIPFKSPVNELPNLPDLKDWNYMAGIAAVAL